MVNHGPDITIIRRKRIFISVSVLRSERNLMMHTILHYFNRFYSIIKKKTTNDWLNEYASSLAHPFSFIQVANHVRVLWIRHSVYHNVYSRHSRKEHKDDSHFHHNSVQLPHHHSCTADTCCGLDMIGRRTRSRPMILVKKKNQKLSATCLCGIRNNINLPKTQPVTPLLSVQAISCQTRETNKNTMCFNEDDNTLNCGYCHERRVFSFIIIGRGGEMAYRKWTNLLFFKFPSDAHQSVAWQWQQWNHDSSIMVDCDARGVGFFFLLSGK